MSQPVIGIVGSGDMGSAVGAMFRRQGYRVVTDLSGRSPASRALAERAGLEDLGSLEAVMREARLFLSILPPASAFDFAGRAVEAIAASEGKLVYADCNAVAPATVEAIGALFGASRAAFIDVGIVGPAPRAGTAMPTRFYVSGAARAVLLDQAVPELAMIDLGDEIGRASALKMGYAALNKGTNALLTAVLMMATRLGVAAELMAEFDSSQPDASRRARRRVPFLAATAARYTGEMREIAATFDDAGITGDFHRGAEWLYARLAESRFADETRASLPGERSLDEALEAFVAVLDAGPPR